VAKAESYGTALRQDFLVRQQLHQAGLESSLILQDSIVDRSTEGGNTLLGIVVSGKIKIVDVTITTSYSTSL